MSGSFRGHARKYCSTKFALSLFYHEPPRGNLIKTKQIITDHTYISLIDFIAKYTYNESKYTETEEKIAISKEEDREFP